MSCAGSSITQATTTGTPSGFIYRSLAHCQTISRVSRRPQKGTLKWMARQWRVIWIPSSNFNSFRLIRSKRGKTSSLKTSARCYTCNTERKTDTAFTSAVLTPRGFYTQIQTKFQILYPGLLHRVIIVSPVLEDISNGVGRRFPAEYHCTRACREHRRRDSPARLSNGPWDFPAN